MSERTGKCFDHFGETGNEKLNAFKEATVAWNGCLYLICGRV
jgi:hypothetical protein